MSHGVGRGAETGVDVNVEQVLHSIAAALTHGSMTRPTPFPGFQMWWSFTEPFKTTCTITL